MLTLIAVIAFLVAKTKRELLILQQNSYFPNRYAQWIQRNVEKYLPRTAIVAFAASLLVYFDYTIIGKMIFAAVCAISAYWVWTQKEKKALAFTPRVNRLFAASVVLAVLPIGVLYFILSYFFAPCAWFWTAVAVYAACAFPTVPYLANVLMQPYEAAVNQGFIDDAAQKLKTHTQLTVIGITGSYGKTSTKHFVARILSEKFNVLMTPGSVNTTLGIVRIVREQLKPTHQIFICEMGAKKRGDVKEICDLVQPDIGILTAVGPEHLDFFGNMDNVQKGNFELIDSLDAADGVAIMNSDYELVANAPHPLAVQQKLYYSVEKGSKARFLAQNITYTEQGMRFEVFDNDVFVLALDTKLLGIHNVSNILAGVIIALRLNMEHARIAYAVRNLQPVKHRLEVKKHANGVTIIDDSYNSNPKGAEMALQVLQQMRGTRKTIVTPGMIELGDEEFALNKAFGKQIAAYTDYAVLVGPKQTVPIQEGLREANYPTEKIYIAKNLQDAMQHLNGRMLAGDVILYENDLPDTYNEQ